MDLTPERRADIRVYLAEVRAYLDQFDGLLDADQLAVDDSDLLAEGAERLRDLHYGYIDQLEAGLPIIDPRDA
jgi:hypothetical protein